MVYNAGRVWCGCDGGQIVVYSLADGALVKTIKAHSDTVDTLTVVGNQVMGVCVGGVGVERGRMDTLIAVGNAGAGCCLLPVNMPMPPPRIPPLPPSLPASPLLLLTSPPMPKRPPLLSGVERLPRQDHPRL